VSKEKIGRSKTLVLLLAFSILLLSTFGPFSQESSKIACNETIKIDGIEYPLPECWCGKKLDSKLLADSKKLAKLPKEISFEEFKIYVTPETKKALLKMAEAAKNDGIDFIVDSGFRSRAYQRQVIRQRLQKGEKFEKMITFVAPPGYSEHHTGRAVDFVPSEARFAFTKTYKWLKNNAAGFGFYESYPEDITSKTPWESWHWIYQSK